MGGAEAALAPPPRVSRPAMAELEIPGVTMNQEYRVKLGKSFTIPKENAFHTIKYDFKPLSVDHSKPGKLRVGEGDEVNMSLPVVQAESADDVFQFRGPKRPCTRECVLIIDTVTGEAVLEKIGSSVNLKSVRDGRPKARDRSISPAPFASKNQAMGKMAQQGKPPTSSTSSSAHKHSKVAKPLAKSRQKKSSDTSGLGTGSSSSGAGNSVKQPSSHAAGSGATESKARKKQSKYSRGGPVAHSEVQPSPAFLALPKTTGSGGSVSGPPVQPTSEPNPFHQSSGSQADPVATQRKETLENSSGSSSGSGSSSSSGSSDSESGEESLVQASLTFPSAGGGGVNVPSTGTAIVNASSMQPPQVPNTVPPSMPIFGAGGGAGASVPISMPTVPVQPTGNEDSSSSSGSDSESSSDSSSGSSSDSSDTEDGKDQAGSTGTVAQQPSAHLIRSISTIEHELSCSSSDSD